MLTYLYECPQCKCYHEVVKDHVDHRRTEYCPVCGDQLDRCYTTPHLYRIKNEQPEYYPAFGKWMKNRNEVKEECRRVGVVEVGNENPEKVVKKFEKDREEKCLQRWQSCDVI